MVDTVTVLSEVMVVVKVVPMPGGRESEPEVLGGTCMLDPGCDDKSVVRAGVRVAVMIERLGGAILFNHSVDPLMTE